MMDISKLLDLELLQQHAKIEAELLQRKIIRTANNPIGDLAEHIFCKAFPDWNQERNAKASFDAIGPTPDELKYQIKGHRIIRDNANCRQLSAIRGLEGAHFDFLAGVLFNEDYSIFKAALIPHAVVLKLATPDEHVNGHRFLLRDGVWDDKRKAEGVEDVTSKLRSVWH